MNIKGLLVRQVLINISKKSFKINIPYIIALYISTIDNSIYSLITRDIAVLVTSILEDIQILDTTTLARKLLDLPL